MSDKTTIALAQLWISHLCHELVSPIGAINNGVELIQDADDTKMDAEALQLIAESAAAAAARLRFYRLAYGRAGSGDDLRLSDGRNAVLELFKSETRVKLDFPPVTPLAFQSGGVQLVLNLIILAAACLPRGGDVSVRVTERAEVAEILVSATGQNARIPETVDETMRGASAEVDHRNSHAALCHALSEKIGVRPVIKAKETMVTIAVELAIRIG